jgi:TonB family protein
MLDSAIKASVIVAVALAANGLLRARSAALRHWVLAAAVACALAVPALEVLVPAWDVPFAHAERSLPVAGTTRPADGSAAAQYTVIADGARPAPSVTTQHVASRVSIAAALEWFSWLWLAGTAGSLAVLFVGLWRLARLASSASPLESARWRAAATAIAGECSLRRPLRLLVGDRPALLVTWGYRRPIVLVPASAASWPDDRVRVVLGHEIAHICRNDWLIVIMGEALRAFHWFNPLMWIACRRLRQESEQACDDAVLRGGVEASAYASHLLDVARSLGRPRHSPLPAPAMVRISSLERRIGAMLNPHLNRTPITRAARIATIALALALTASIAGIGAAAQIFGSVSGSVVDSTNRAISGATLVLTGAPNQAKQELKSDASGHFEFIGLPTGGYRLEASAPGFATFREELPVSGQPQQRTVMLHVGSLMETLTVSGPRDARGPRPAFVEPPPPDLSRCVATASGGVIEQPRRISDARPDYPIALYDTNIAGRVVLEGRIGTDGAFRELRVATPAHPDFEAAALEAVRQWRFSQTLLNCVPVEVSMTVHVNFVPRP